MIPKNKSLILIFTSVILTACGGGGDSKDEVITEQKVTLTQENYLAVAKEALKSSPLITYEGFFMQVPNSMQAFVFLGINEIRNILDRSPGDFPQTVTQVDCNSSGSITYKDHDNNNNRIIDAGDFFEITYKKCNTRYYDGSLTSRDGSLVIIPSTNWTMRNVSASLKYNNYTIQSKDSSSTATGDGVMNFDMTSFGSRSADTEVNAESFLFKAVTPKTTSIQTFKEYQASSSIRSPYFISSVTSTVIISTLGNKSITITTPTPFRNAPSTYPVMGFMEIKGANQALIRITAIDGKSATIELDQNGDGAYEASQIMPWDALIHS